MGQILQLPDGTKLDVDRAYIDGGLPAQYGLIGGTKVQLSSGTNPKPQVFQRGESFFYGDGAPVNKTEDVDWIPEKARVRGKDVNPRALALAFVERQQKAEASEKAAATNGTAAAGRRRTGSRGSRKRGGVTVRHADDPRNLRPQDGNAPGGRPFDPTEALGPDALKKAESAA